MMKMMGDGSDMGYVDYGNGYYDNNWSIIPPDYVPPEDDYRYNSYA